MTFIPGIIACQNDLEEIYITSEMYPLLTTDTFTATGSVLGADLGGNNFMFGPARDRFDVSASMQGNHDLITIRADHEVYDIDTFDLTASMQGNHALTVVRVDHEVYDTDTFDLSASMQGNHALTVVRIDHEIYDTDTFDVTASMQGNHTLS